MAVNKALLKNALDMFDIWGDEAITDSTRSRTLVTAAKSHDMWEPFEGVEKAALFVNHFSRGLGGQRAWVPVGLLRFNTSPTTCLKALHYTNGLVCYDEQQNFLGQEWITYCHPMTVEGFKSRLST